MATVKLDPAKGVQIPNMTTTERNAVSSPETGALVWNTTTSAINQYNGSAWEATDTNTQADISGKLNLSGGTLTGGLSGTTAAFSSTITSNGQAQLNNNNLIGLNTGATSEWIAKRTSSGEGIHISTTNASGADTQRLAITSNANTADFIVKASNVGIGTTSPTNKLTVDIETLGDGIDLIDGDVAHGITDYLPTNASLRLTEANATEGGARIYGATDNAGQMGLSLYGLCPDGAVATVRNVQIIGAEKSGTGIAAVAADKLVLGVYNNTTELMTINGAGDMVLANHPYWKTLRNDTGLTSQSFTYGASTSYLWVTFSSTNASADMIIYGYRLHSGQWHNYGWKIGNGTPSTFSDGTTISDTNNTYQMSWAGGSNQMTFSRSSGSTNWNICVKTVNNIR